jgi:hypothetical protein
MTHVHSRSQGRQPISTGGTPAHAGHRLTPFWRHYLQMVAAMMVGMVATGAIFLSVVGLRTWEEVTLRYPTQALLAMAVGMTLPMVVWMEHVGMRRSHTYEMAAAMVISAVPCLLLVWLGITKGAACGAYCILMLLSMWAVMHRHPDKLEVPSG